MRTGEADDSVRRNLHRPSLQVAAVLVAVAAVAAGAVWLSDGGTGGNGGQKHKGQHTSITVNGKPVPYAGRVPWSDAILDPHNPRRIFVFADGGNMRGKPTCVLPIERPSVHATTHEVEILIAGYANPIPPNTACAPVGPSPQDVAVTLPSPLGQRSLIDITTGLHHPVLNPATVPDVGIPVPTGYVAQPISWDERTGIVTHDWVSRACATQCLIEMRYAPPTSDAQFDLFSGLHITGDVPVHHARATIYTYREKQFTETALVWTRSDHSRILISVGGLPGRQTPAPTRAQAIALARSIQ